MPKLTILLITLFLGLNSLGGENSMRIIKPKLVLSHNFEIIFETASKKYIFNSLDKNIETKAKELTPEIIKTINKVYFSLSYTNGYLTDYVFNKIPFSDASKLMMFLLSASVSGQFSKQILKSLDQNQSIGVWNQEDAKMYIYNASNKPLFLNFYNKTKYYEFSTEGFFEDFAIFYDKLNLIIEVYNIENNNSFLKSSNISKIMDSEDSKKIDGIMSTDDSQLQLVEEVLLFQGCVVAHACKDILDFYTYLINKQFIKLNNKALGQFLIGINLGLSLNIIDQKSLSNLFFEYMQKSKDLDELKYIIKKFKDFFNRQIKEQMDLKIFNEYLDTLEKRKTVWNTELINLLISDLNDTWKDFSSSQTIFKDNLISLPSAILKVQSSSNVNLTIKVVNAGKSNFDFEMQKSESKIDSRVLGQNELRNSNNIKDNILKFTGLNSRELVFPHQTLLSISFDKVNFIHEMPVQDLFTTLRLFHFSNLPIGAERIITFLDGISKVKIIVLKDNYLFYSLNPVGSIGYKVSKDSFDGYSSDSIMSQIYRDLEKNIDGKLQLSESETHILKKSISESKNLNLQSIEQLILSIKDMRDLYKDDIIKDNKKYDVSFIAIEKHALIPIESFDRMISTHISQFSDKSMRHLIDLGFYRSEDNFHFTKIVADELVKNKNITLQSYFVESFLKTQDDPVSVGTNQANLYILKNEYFAHFQEDVLGELLLGGSNYFESDDLFMKYLAFAKNKLLAEKVLSKYKNIYFSRFWSSYGSHLSWEQYLKAKNDKLDHLVNEQSLYIFVDKLKLLKRSPAISDLYDQFIKDLLLYWEEVLAHDIVDANKVLDRMMNRMTDNEFRNSQVTQDVFEIYRRQIDYKVFGFEKLYLVFQKSMNLGDCTYANTKLLFALLIQYDSTQLEAYLKRDLKKSFKLSPFNRNVSQLIKDYPDSIGIKREHLIDEEFIAKIQGYLSGLSEEQIRNNIIAKKEERLKKINEYEFGEEESAIRGLYLELEDFFEGKMLNNKNFDLKKSLQKYITESNKILSNSKFSKKHSYSIAEYTTKLAIKFSATKQYNLGKIVLINYMETQLPLIGFSEKTSDVASNGLVLSILSNDDDLSKKIFTNLLSNTFDITTEKNPFLLFNLACYYSLKKEKQKMLDAIKYSLIRGKEPQQFKSDVDFKFYWKDKEFLGVLETKN